MHLKNRRLTERRGGASRAAGPVTPKLMPAGSLREQVPFETRRTDTGLRPGIASAWMEANRDRFICPLTEMATECVMFDDRLVHVGPPNFSNDLRLSAEFTILARDR